MAALASDILFLTSPVQSLNGIQRNLTGSKISTSSLKFVFLADSKSRRAHWLLIGINLLNFTSATTKRNSTKLDWKEDLTSFAKFLGVFFFGLIKNSRLLPLSLIG